MLSKIVELCETRGFLFKSDHLRIGPLGVLLREIVKAEWLNFHVTHKDINIFLNEGNSFKDTFEFVKRLYNDQFPFGIAEMLPNQDEHLNNSNGIKYAKDFADKTLLKCTIFVAPSMSTQFFHQWQRQRRIWWRKFSASPDRYCFSDIKNVGLNNQSVDIVAKHPWGTEIVEKITINTSLPTGLPEQQLQIKNGKKATTVHHIVNEISLSTLTLNTICDAYEEPIFMGKNREVLHFHRKIAPYKLAFAITSKESSVVGELEDLALYLCKLLKNQNITTLVLPNCHRIALGSLFKQYDEMGVPYTVHLKEETLKNGIFGLRSRDTTLEEHVHVTQFVDYVEKIFKNF